MKIPSRSGSVLGENQQRLLQCLNRYVVDYYDDREDPAGCIDRSANYEDLAYLATQLSESISRERDNPALEPFVERVSAELRIRKPELRDLAEEVSVLINDHVLHCLSGIKPLTNHLACVRKACAANSGNAIPILTLNHDCLIESVLRTDKIEFNDLTRSTKDGRRPLGRMPSRKGVNLFKLHGSIDWFRWRPIIPRYSDPFREEWLGALDIDPLQEVWRSDSGRPLMLIGRFNKELSYAEAPFAHIFASSRQALSQVSKIVVSGYSFGDKAVNAMLIDWIYGASAYPRRIYVAHSNVEKLQNDARGAIRNKWGQWTEDGVLVSLGAFVDDLNWRQLQRAISA